MSITIAGYRTADGYTIPEIQTLLAQKQNKLTFDASPKSGSTNPVTSGGIYNSINTIKSGTKANSAYHLGLYIDSDGDVCQE